MADIIDIASKEVGYKAYGGNKTKYSAWYGMNGAAWCHMFASWCAYKAGVSTALLPRQHQQTQECNGLKTKEDSSIRAHTHLKEMISFILNQMVHLTLELLSMYQEVLCIPLRVTLLTLL